MALQSVWRMVCVRRPFLESMQRTRAARTIQALWRMRHAQRNYLQVCVCVCMGGGGGRLCVCGGRGQVVCVWGGGQAVSVCVGGRGGAGCVCVGGGQVGEL